MEESGAQKTKELQAEGEGSGCEFQGKGMHPQGSGASSLCSGPSVNISGFAECRASVATTQLRCCSMKVTSA